jgi:hypothetical protein
MHSQEYSYSRSRPADFASALERASTPEKSTVDNQSDKSSKAQSYEEYGPYNNRNISSILSRIADEGPANLNRKDSTTRKKDVSRRTTVEAQRLEEDRYTPSIPASADQHVATPQSLTFDEADLGDTEQKYWKKYSLWQQIALLVLIAVLSVMGFLLYQLTLQAGELSNAVNLQAGQAPIQNSTHELPAEVLRGLTNLGNALSELKQELHEIRIDQQKENKRLDMNKPDELDSLLMYTTTASQHLGDLKAEFGLILDGMRDVEVEAGTGALTEVSLPKKRTMVKDAMRPVQKKDLVNKLVVNLATLTSEAKARAAYEKLLQAGVTPLIEEVVLNDKKVYRLSVDGFSSREEAYGFIAKAGERYGFEGGWIRQY